MSPQPPKLFIAYARPDRPFLDAFVRHLAPMRREGLLSIWHDGEIGPGENWQSAIHHHIESADIIVLLVSASFIHSEYCYRNELPVALQRHEARQVVIIPVIVSSCDWTRMPFARIQALPDGGKAVNTWPDHDVAWTNVAFGIRSVLNRLTASRAQERAVTGAHVKRTSPAIFIISAVAAILIVTIVVALIASRNGGRGAQDPSMLPYDPSRPIK